MAGLRAGGILPGIRRCQHTTRGGRGERQREVYGGITAAGRRRAPAADGSISRRPSRSAADTPP